MGNNSLRFEPKKYSQIEKETQILLDAAEHFKDFITIQAFRRINTQWLGISSQLKDLVENCPNCIE